MNDPYSVHGLDHLSPSQINTFISDPCKWVLRVSGYTGDGGGAGAWRGSATDNAITTALQENLSAEKAVELGRLYMLDRLKQYPTVDSKKFEDEQTAVDKFIKEGLFFYRRLPKPTQYQGEISLQLDHLPIPITGKADFVYEDKVRDLKTVKQKPDRIKDSHARQVAIYATALGMSEAHVDYVYVTKTKNHVYHFAMGKEEIQEAMNLVNIATKSMTRLLSVSSNIEDIAGLLTPDFDDWMWSPADKEAARKLWRM